MITITRYYPSTVRANRFGTSCDNCHKRLEKGTKIMRAETGRNDFGCMTYSVYDMDCYNKILPKKIEQSEEALLKEMEKLQELKCEMIMNGNSN